ncbi:uncharacterized protein V1513DRAFT_439658 [Lipomyces chichibuensis]|uniref:uncharacterized protein n=1 Tax=Lipomyces chichibuensis TaxID=1546026 RepID=UPI003343BE11
MSGYFALDYSAPMQPPLPLALEAEMLLYSSSTPSASAASDFTFVDQFSLATSPAASMSSGACSPFDRVHRDHDSACHTSFTLEPSDLAPVSSASSIDSLNATSTTAAGINPCVFFSRTTMSEDDEDNDVVIARSLNDFQFRPSSATPTAISTTSEPSPSSSSAQSPYSASAPGLPTSRSAQNQNQRRAARRPPLTSSRSAPSVSQTHSLTAGVAPTKNAAGKFQCTECSRSYLHAKHLKRHMLRHTGDRPYKCSLCSDSFCRSDILKRHYEKCQHRRANVKSGAGRVGVSSENAAADETVSADAVRGNSSSRCDECLGAGIRCAREDGHMCVRLIAGLAIDVPQFQNPSPPMQHQQQEYQYFPKSGILGGDDETEPVVLAIPPNEFQLPIPMQPQSHMYDFNLLSYYPDMVDTQMQQAHVQSPMQFYA